MIAWVPKMWRSIYLVRNLSREPTISKETLIYLSMGEAVMYQKRLKKIAPQSLLIILVLSDLGIQAFFFTFDTFVKNVY